MTEYVLHYPWGMRVVWFSNLEYGKLYVKEIQGLTIVNHLYSLFRSSMTEFLSSLRKSPTRLGDMVLDIFVEYTPI